MDGAEYIRRRKLADLVEEIAPRGFFLSQSQLARLVDLERLRLVLIRFGEGRCLAPAQDAARLIAAAERGGWYVRDVSLPSSDPDVRRVGQSFRRRVGLARGFARVEAVLLGSVCLALLVLVAWWAIRNPSPVLFPESAPVVSETSVSAWLRVLEERAPDGSVRVHLAEPHTGARVCQCCTGEPFETWLDWIAEMDYLHGETGR